MKPISAGSTLAMHFSCATVLSLARSQAATLGLFVLLVLLPSAPLSAQPAQDTAPVEAAEADATAENAIPTRSVFSIMRDGGVLMWPILACSLITVAIAMERAISLRKGRVIPGPFVRRFLHQLSAGELDRQSALDLCEENPSPVAEVFAGAIRRWGRPAVEVEQAMLDAGERAVNGLRRNVRVLNAIATVSPLLGLLGTVFGMIQAFNAIATVQALGRPELLAAGISVALLTTAFGLTVAIPSLICYLYFISRVDQLIMQIDALGQEIVNVVSAEAIEEAGRTKPSRARRQESVS